MEQSCADLLTGIIGLASMLRVPKQDVDGLVVRQHLLEEGDGCGREGVHRAIAHCVSADRIYACIVSLPC